MKILHIGLCATPNTMNGFQKAFIDVVGQENYREIYTGEIGVNKKTIELVDKFKPDIIFFQVQAPDVITLETFLYCHKSGAFVINWTGDKRHDVPAWMIDCAHMVSVTAFSNMEDVHKMRAMGFKSEFLEIGYDPEIYKPDGEIAAGVPEIVFMGNNYGDNHFPMSKFRREMVEFLQKEYGPRFGVYGTGWPNPKGNVNHSQWEEAKVYRGAKIAINCSHFDCDTYNSDRILRILGSGVNCLSYEHHGMKNVFKDNVLYFKSFEELKYIIDELSNPAQVIGGEVEMLGKGNEFALNNFTFNHQVQNIIKLANGNIN